VGLPQTFPDDYAKLRRDVAGLKYAVAAGQVVELQAATLTDETITVAAKADSGWQKLSGPSLPVHTDAGIIVVTVSGRIKIPSSNTGAQAAIAYHLLDANNVEQVPGDLTRAVWIEFKGATAGASTQDSFTYVHTGLPPGDYTLEALHRYWDGSGAVTGTFTADFINRSLIAKGY
jgi:hypothetical protein